jgi:hypothetical protein
MKRPIRIRRMLLCVPLLGCLNTDFGRVRPSLVIDDIHAWMGPAVTAAEGLPASEFRLTEDERLLRDLGYALIAPPYARGRWFSVLNEYGRTAIFQPEWWRHDETFYVTSLLASPTRTADALYARLIDDIRNDAVRIKPFLDVARRVRDMDDRRKASLAHIRGLTPLERDNALARINENDLIVRWVHRALEQRALSYQLTLERLVISVPSRKAADAERQLNVMRRYLARA